jgi:hypothetical protein
MQQFLAACAHARPNDQTLSYIVQAAMHVRDWTTLATQAEEQGLAPLLYAQLQQAEIALPREVKRELQGLFLRHRHAHQVRLEILQNILHAFNAANIQALLLKGAALAYLVYPEPHLRPMRDMDILVKKSDARQAQQLLQELGFDAPVPAADALLPDKHLASASYHTQGMMVSVEIHHNLFNGYYHVSMDIDNLTSAPLAFNIDNTSTYTLGYEDMLWHLCQHVAYHANVWEPIRLVWVADIVGFAERFALQIDWARVARQYPLVLNTLSLFHFITPLSPQLLRLAPIKMGRLPQGLGEEFMGWPRTSLANQRGKGYRRILADTFFPSEWWLRLHYGLNSAQPLFWYRWGRHPLHILGRLRQFYLSK